MAGAAAHHRTEKNAREKKIGPFPALSAAFAAFFFLLSASSVMPRPADTLEQLQEKFDKETDAVRKAKMLQKLGDTQFEKERAATKAGDFVAAGLVMEKYRDNVRAALELLKTKRPQAEKNPNGYKQLEYHTAQGLREVRDVILAMPEQLRPPMQIVENELREMNMELLKLLFPRRPGEQPPIDPRASTPKTEEKSEKQP